MGLAIVVLGLAVASRRQRSLLGASVLCGALALLLGAVSVLLGLIIP